MEIRIRKNSPSCYCCSKNFEHQEVVWSQLIKDEDEIERQDYCCACWEKKDDHNVFSFWRHKYIDPKVVKKIQETRNDSPLRALFYNMLSKEGNRKEEAIAYLSAQLLRRERIFKKIKEFVLSKSDGHIVIYVDKVDEKVVEVRDPNFSYDELEEARKYICEFLESNTKLTAPETI